MPKFLQKLYTGFVPAKVALFFVGIFIYLFLIVCSGGSVIEGSLFWFAVLGYIVLPGYLLSVLFSKWKLLKEYRGMFTILFGVGFFAFLYCITMRLSALWLLKTMPLILSVICIFLFILQKERISFQKIKSQITKPNNMLLLLLFATLLVMFSFTYVVKNAHPSLVGDIVLNHDFLWNVGNAESFKIRFIPEDIRFIGVQLHYHYLTELVAGALSIVTGISAYNILGFYFGPCIIIALIYCLYIFGNAFYKGNQTKTMLFTFSMFLFGCASLWKMLPNGQGLFWNTNVYHLISNINSQATGIIFLCIFSTVFLYCVTEKFKVSFIEMGLLFISFFLLCFAKGPVAGIAVCAVAITLIWLFVQKKVNGKGLLSAIVLAGMFIVIYQLFFSSGANTSVQFDISHTLKTTYFAPYLQWIWDRNLYIWYLALPVTMIVHTFCMAPFQSFLYACGLGKDIKNLFKLEGDRLYANSALIGGVLAFYLFHHPSMSQLYFIFMALFFINLLAVDMIDRIKARWVKAFAVCFACVGLVTNAFLYVNLVGSGARQLGRNMGIIEKYPYEFVMNADDEVAMQWLQDNTDTSIVFATNRIHTGAAREGLSNVYSAMSGRQAFMEGFKYALTNMGVPEAVIKERLAVNDALFDAATSSEELLQLCERAGITHIVYCEQFWGDEEQLACFELVFESETVRIYATGVEPHTIHTLYLQ